MAEEVEVSLLFFAKSRELTGVKESVLNVKQRTTAKEILEQILIKFPSLEVLSENLVLSLNEEYISVDDQIQVLVHTGDALAVIPPISGG